MTLRYGWYGDDFTGATDTLATVARAGLRAMLFLGVPSAALLARAGPLDAIGIAGDARTRAPAAMAEALVPVGRFFADQAVDVLHYKCCSTFDSAPEVGSIGAAVACLRQSVSNRLVPIVGGQPGIGRYCAFSTLFAAAGQDGEVHRIDRHPTMAHHPVTPMGEADLRRHLAAQGLSPVAAVQAPDYARGIEGVRARAAEQAAAVLFDVTRQEDLTLIGAFIREEAARARLLAVGASSVAEAVLAMAVPRSTPLAASTGPVLAVIGSLSPVSRAQAARASSYAAIELPSVLTDAAVSAAVGQAVSLLRGGRSVMISGAASIGSGNLKQATAAVVCEIVRRASPRRIGIAGGDTSSQAALDLASLGLWGLSCQQTLDAGVTLCRAHATTPELDGVELMPRADKWAARICSSACWLATPYNLTRPLSEGEHRSCQAMPHARNPGRSTADAKSPPSDRHDRHLIRSIQCRCATHRQTPAPSRTHLRGATPRR